MYASEERSALIEVSGVSKIYRADGQAVPALRDVAFTVAEGEFVSLLGPSGCGKTTLMMAVVGLTDIDTGLVRIHGQTIDRAYTDVGIIFQNPELLEWRSALQNVLLQIEIRRLPLRDYQDRARALLEQVGLGKFAERYPHELSGGMKQRVALCRALVHDPEILLLDEPFGALDAMTRDQMNLDLQTIWLERQKTAMLVTHSIEEAVFLSDRVIVMSPRPGTVADIVAIDLPRPRSLNVKDTPDFRKYAAQLRQLFLDLGVFTNG